MVPVALGVRIAGSAAAAWGADRAAVAADDLVADGPGSRPWCAAAGSAGDMVQEPGTLIHEAWPSDPGGHANPRRAADALVGWRQRSNHGPLAKYRRAASAFISPAPRRGHPGAYGRPKPDAAYRIHRAYYASFWLVRGPAAVGRFPASGEPAPSRHCPAGAARCRADDAVGASMAALASNISLSVPRWNVPNSCPSALVWRGNGRADLLCGDSSGSMPCLFPRAT